MPLPVLIYFFYADCISHTTSRGGGDSSGILEGYHISRTGQLQLPAGHWQEAPQLHPWSPIRIVSVVNKVTKKNHSWQPRFDPAIVTIEGKDTMLSLWACRK
jgi:hypothetical protein